MYRYEVKRIPGRNRHGIFVDGMLLAVVEDKRMHREAELLVKLADMVMTGEYLKPPAPIVMVGSEEERERMLNSFTVSEAEIQEDLNRRPM